MSAVFGICRLDGSPASTERLDQAARSLSHHALDASGRWIQDSLALAHAMTHFTAESRTETLPLVDTTTGIVLTADARIDNRPELARELGVSLAELKDMPDSRLILLAYLAWGEDCPKHLIGDFVFVLWDPRQHHLFGARDPIGIRWLYYFFNGRSFAFSSDMVGLLDLMDDAPRLDLVSLDHYFRGGSSYTVRNTFYKNVYKLQPGQSICIYANGRQKTQTYWRPEDVRPLGIRDPREGAEMLKSLLVRAVEDRNRSLDPIGVHVSGGMDSSAVAIIAAQHLTKAGRLAPLGFSWSPPFELLPMLEMDERIYVQRVAEYAGMDVRYIHVPPEVDALLETSDPAILPNNTLRYEYTLMMQARQSGVRTIFSGWGGDEFVFVRPRNYIAGLAWQGRFGKLLLLLPERYSWNVLRYLKAIYRDGIIPSLPARWQDKMPTASLFKKSNPHNLLIQQLIEEKRKFLPAYQYFHPDFYSKLQKIHQPSQSWYRPGMHLTQIAAMPYMLIRIESWAAWSARLGIRHLYPLLDQRIIEFSLASPEDWAMLGKGSRVFASMALSGIIPDNLFSGRDKRDRALIVHQKTPEHKAVVRQLRLQFFDALQKTSTPVKQWLNFEYLRAVQLPEDELAHLPFSVTERRGIWEVLAFAYTDPRVILDD